ncbi:MAG: hypothetical protein PHV30_09955 [Candidatus Margulisbacteria bacterium]|nr:hypothetical protein [Candidatus Margulisiibacteriota bacterium]
MKTDVYFIAGSKNKPDKKLELAVIRFFIGLFLIISTILCVLLLEGANLSAYLAPTALVVVVLITFFASLCVWNVSELNSAWKDAFNPEDSTSLYKSTRILDFFEKLFYFSGILCTILGIVFILSQLQSFSKMGVGLAFSMLGILYGTFLGIVTRILRAKIENKKK